MPEKLNFSLLSRNRKASRFNWINIDRGNFRVGKMRTEVRKNELIIYSINIFPDFEGHGYARKTIELLKGSFDLIIADRVRPKAIGFWKKMGFIFEKEGVYAYRKGGLRSPAQLK
jgi:hypothetical protein